MEVRAELDDIRRPAVDVFGAAVEALKVPAVERGIASDDVATRGADVTTAVVRVGGVVGREGDVEDGAETEVRCTERVRKTS